MTMTENRNDFFNMMLVTAIEGGTGYWCAVSEYKPNEVEWYAIVESNDDDWGVEQAYVSEANEEGMIQITETQALRVDVKVIERGWNQFMDLVIEAAKSEDDDAPCSRRYFRQAVVQYLTNCVYGDSDAEVADFVMQFGLFGEIVYA